MKRSESIVRAVLVVLFGYLLSLGATFTGVVTPEFSSITLAIAALLAFVWLMAHWIGGWRWHHTPLDGVFLLWAVAFVVSILANSETWRRSVIALWYVGLYIGVWYALSDLIANRAAKRETIIDAFLFGGLIVLAFGVWQITFGSGGVRPRPVSTLGNPNFLGAFLVVLTPLALGRLASVRNRVGRFVLVLYMLVSVGLLLLTGSRGSWIGLAAALAVWGVLTLAHQDLLSFSKLRVWWRTQSARVRVLVGSAGLVAVVGAGAAGFLIVRSLSEPGRDVGLRTYLYDAALTLFSEKPLTGHGLFTFGHTLGRFSSIPPAQTHSHAHNAPLHIASELGIVGLVALAATLVMMFLTMRRNWRVLQGRERVLFAGAAAAVCGFAAHQQFDVPAMMPAIALVGMVALVLALRPAEQQSLTARWRMLAQPVSVIVLVFVLVVSGVWSQSIYQRYITILREGVSTENYRTAAEQMQSVIDSDPAMSIYSAQQAYLFGLAANSGNSDSLINAIAAYERVVQLEPYYAPLRANLAALFFEAGDYANAIETMQTAAELAPDAWQLWYGAGVMAETAQDQDDLAVELYKKALAAQPDAYLHPDWGALLLQNDALEDIELQPSPLAQAVLYLESGDVDAALEAWTQFDGTVYPPPAPEVVRMIIALAQNDRAGATAWLRRAELVAPAAEQRVWQHFGLAKLAQFDGDSTLAAQELDAAREALEIGLLDEDIRSGQSFAYAQFLRQAIPRQLLPQVYYPVASPLLGYLLEKG